MSRYVDIAAVCREIDKGDLLVGNNADWAKETVYRTTPAKVKKIVYGRWKTREYDNDYSNVECSCCGYIAENYRACKFGVSSLDIIGHSWNFCPSCGADMILDDKGE